MAPFFDAFSEELRKTAVRYAEMARKGHLSSAAMKRLGLVEAGPGVIEGVGRAREGTREDINLRKDFPEGTRASERDKPTPTGKFGPLGSESRAAVKAPYNREDVLFFPKYTIARQPGRFLKMLKTKKAEQSKPER